MASAKRREVERLKSLMSEEAVMELEKMSNVKKTTITAIGKTPLSLTQPTSREKICWLSQPRRDSSRCGGGTERASNQSTLTKMTLPLRTKTAFVF